MGVGGRWQCLGIPTLGPQSLGPVSWPTDTWLNPEASQPGDGLLQLPVPPLSCQSFDDDYSDFETKIQDLDRRLATIFCQAFDDCNCIESSAKVGEQSCPALQGQRACLSAP